LKHYKGGNFVKRFIVCILVLTSLLVACTQHQAPRLEAQALTYDTIDWLTFDKNIDAGIIKRLRDLGNCVANGLNVTGQPPRNGGVAGTQDGGLTYDEFGLPKETGITTASRVGKNWLSVQGLLGTPQRNATILIVDDFHGVYSLKPELFTQTTLDGVTLPALQDSGKLSHGALVLQHTKDVIQGTGLYPYRSTTRLGDKIIYRTTQLVSRFTKTLTVKTLDPGFANGTSEIAGSITSAVMAQKLNAALDAPGGPFVVNMSFAFLPCLAYADYIRWDEKTISIDETFIEYVEALTLKQSPSVSSDEMANLLVAATDTSNDPLKKLLFTDKAIFKHVFVAASGNYGFNTPMFPAQWPWVMDVTGSTAKEPNLRSTLLFNKGGIMETGASFKLEASRFVLNPNLYPPLKNVYYIGTSFSTPSLSVFSALDLAGKKHCTQVSYNSFGDVILTIPRLGINTQSNGQSLVDSPLVDAVSKLCKP
jgi:hypothetical protein